MSLRFTHPYIASTEMDAVRSAIESGHTWGDGPFTLSAAKRLTDMLGAAHVAIVTSGTDAAELAGIVADFGPGDGIRPDGSGIEVDSPQSVQSALDAGIPRHRDDRRNRRRSASAPLRDLVTTQS